MCKNNAGLELFSEAGTGVAARGACTDPDPEAEQKERHEGNGTTPRINKCVIVSVFQFFISTPSFQHIKLLPPGRRELYRETSSHKNLVE